MRHAAARVRRDAGFPGKTLLLTSPNLWRQTQHRGRSTLVTRIPKSRDERVSAALVFQEIFLWSLTLSRYVPALIVRLPGAASESKSYWAFSLQGAVRSVSI